MCNMPYDDAEAKGPTFQVQADVLLAVHLRADRWCGCSAVIHPIARGSLSIHKEY